MELIKNEKEYTEEEKDKYIDDMKETYKSMLQKGAEKLDFLFDSLDKDILFNSSLEEISEVCNAFIGDFMIGYIAGLKASYKEECMKNLSVVKEI